MEQREELSVKEIAVLLDRSYITVLNYIKEGKIAGGIQRGREWFVPKSEVDRYLKEGNAINVEQLSVPATMVLKEEHK